MWSLHLIPKILLTFCAISGIKAGQIWLWILPGRQKRAIIFFSGAFISSEDFSVLVQ